MFIDRVEILTQAGDGGKGCGSFRREAFIPRGGPDGGDGGHGGSIIIRADENVGSLHNLVGHRHWKADHGRPGEGSLCTGRSGDDAFILVPPGTVVKDAKEGFVITELLTHGQEITIAKGGKGGRGNKRFATSTERAPRHFEDGEPGEIREVLLELKLIADVGLVGKPNAGKSTLLSRLSRATPEIAAYPFTTKYPHLGMVRVGYEDSFVLADIPGLIEGAHAGVGLGHEFLKHVQRTRLFVHLVEPEPMDQTDPIQNYHQIREELRLYDPELVTRPEIVVVTKCELPDAGAIAEMLSEDLGHPVLQISSATGQGLTELTRLIVRQLREMNNKDEEWGKGTGVRS
ncbi:GTPase ObgE [Planctomicrobium piriforme]|uniref:GTPase Obg n=1 Tax=Planctomicrobium piriforme TaxID=1576369 RepID=A0A1I3NDM0_9PLAN|nr:GTPase ObgE [Planctomicrobium piriforme]SFJ06906.1 GTP-binding protein [Planctomicrobium piriforme]